MGRNDGFPYEPIEDDAVDVVPYWRIVMEKKDAEIERLTAKNAELLTACELAFKKLSGFAPETANARTIIEAAIANAQPQGE